LREISAALAAVKFVMKSGKGKSGRLNTASAVA